MDTLSLQKYFSKMLYKKLINLLIRMGKCAILIYPIRSSKSLMQFTEIWNIELLNFEIIIIFIVTFLSYLFQSSYQILLELWL